MLSNSKTSTDERLYKRIMDSILLCYLEDYSFTTNTNTSTSTNHDDSDDDMNTTDDDDDDEEENEMKLKHVDIQKVANYIFQYASDVNTIDARRQCLYDMYT